jgi:hypothetical protein
MKTNVETVARGKASVHTHQTAPTQFIEAAGKSLRVPLLRQPPLRCNEG